ncbi:hypothetical protein H0H92_000205 [Tricholoma furcatifolium]|nr:hypothetical protein H0H92_000205 [Tricholoma furcatifolium]
MASEDKTIRDASMTTSPPVSGTTVPSTATPMSKAFYADFLARLTNLYGNNRQVTPALPAAPPVSPKIVKAFTSLGSNFLGSPAEIDDRQKIFRDGMVFMASTSKDNKKLNESAIALLHSPQRGRPTTFLANKSPNSLRQYPFARRSENTTSLATLPPVTQIFDELLAGSHVEHPNGFNGVCSALLSIISLSLVRVHDAHPEFNETSPYLDLSPLYGVNEAESELVRAKDGRGMLSPDCFFDDRVMFHSPAVAVLLILWNRNHNYIARHLLLNNEGKKWVDPSEHESPDGTISPALLAQDNEIFRIAKDINCVQMKNVVVEDFLKILAGVPHVGPGPRLDIMTHLKQSEKGKGHESTVESSLLYSRWSSLSSKQDSEAFERLVTSELGLSDDIDNPSDIAALTTSSFHDLLHDSASRNPNKRQRNFAGLRRNSDGRFKDEDLARVLQDATEQVAGAAGAQRVPPCYRPAELVCLERARQWKVGTLNEFRKALGLRPLKDFVDWNPDPNVSGPAERCYQTIDALELYPSQPGLQAEAVMDGSGLALGYTLTYALLVDLVTLIRSDPKFTTDFTPGRLTHWGIKDCVTSPENGGFNTWLPKLLQRNLARHYPYDNIYSVFPLTRPEITRNILMPQQTICDLYTYDRPEVQTVRILETKQAISHVFNNATTYPTTYGKSFKALSNGFGYLLAFDDEKLHDRELMMVSIDPLAKLAVLNRVQTLFALIPDKGALLRYGEYFGRTAASLIKEKATRNNAGTAMTIDIVRDVINVTCTRWCGLPQSNEGEQVHTIHEDFGALYGFIFRNAYPEHGWAMRARALEAAKTLEGQIKKVLPIPKAKATPTYKEMAEDNLNDWASYFNRIRMEISESGILLSESSPLTFLNRLVKSNRTQAFRLGAMAKEGHLLSLVTISPNQAANEIFVREEKLEERRLVSNILGLAIVTSINYAQMCSQAVDFYLHEDRVKERNEIIRLATLPAAEAHRVGANAVIMGYIREAHRLSSTPNLWRDVATDDLIPQGHNLPPIPVRKGERIFADFNKAHNDARDVERPFEINPARNMASLLGMGLHKCPAGGFIDQMFKAIFRLRGLRRDAGKSGRLEQLVCHPAPLKTDPKVYLDPTGEISHFPRSLSLLFDVDVAEVPSFPSERSTRLFQKKNRKWETTFGKKTAGLRESTDRAVKAVILVIIIFDLICMDVVAVSAPQFLIKPPDAILYAAASIRSPFPKQPKFSTHRLIQDTDIQRDNSTCRTPTTLIHPYQMHAFLPGSDGVHPEPLEYTLDGTKPHRLSIVAIGNRDLRMGVYVDDVLRGMTTRIVRNSTESCGEVVSDCLAKKFSAGLVVVPAGNHSVRIEWASNGFIPNTTDEADRELDWVAQPDRRFMWKREYCA